MEVLILVHGQLSLPIRDSATRVFFLSQRGENGSPNSCSWSIELTYLRLSNKSIFSITERGKWKS